MFTCNNISREAPYGLYGVSVFDPYGVVFCEALAISPKKAFGKANRICDLLNQYGQ